MYLILKTSEIICFYISTSGVIFSHLSLAERTRDPALQLSFDSSYLDEENCSAIKLLLINICE